MLRPERGVVMMPAISLATGNLQLTARTHFGQNLPSGCNQFPGKLSHDVRSKSRCWSQAAWPDCQTFLAYKRYQAGISRRMLYPLTAFYGGYNSHHAGIGRLHTRHPYLAIAFIYWEFQSGLSLSIWPPWVLPRSLRTGKESAPAPGGEVCQPCSLGTSRTAVLMVSTSTGN